ncbi:hypothetical protein LR948_08180 [Roseivivax sp. GX 12232]|uniref:hypothetical protein n=1 Tax=Roseivivax sp. GX 12232 TaxID=2900547 RepID=UPI001E2BDC77|nr:hypothetical protein [Roseivivax sp. GX 12232]MCE0505324.1 hypothetical protein [Roseivivax sp. GX 12232]
MRALAALAGWGRWLLIAGLVAGTLLPGLARAFAPAIVPLLAVLLCLAGLREGPRAALPARAGLRSGLTATLALQFALPLLAGAALWAGGLLDAPLALAALLVFAAAPITGAPGLAVMSGADAGAALRQLTLGTALLPLTALPVFALLPVFPDPMAVFGGALRLLLLIALAVGLAGLLRRVLPALSRPEARPAIDGAMALAMALVVVGLMSALAPAARDAPGALALTFLFAWALYLAQSLGAWRIGRRLTAKTEARAFAISAGNRNLALFLAAIPPEMAAPFMVFIGCYQVPMYLTPLVLPRLTGRG